MNSKWYKVVSLSLAALFMLTTGWSEDSTNIKPGDEKPNAVFLLAQGYINQVADPNSEQQQFAIHQTCPPNFKPYVTIRMSKTAYASGQDVTQGFGVCVNGLTKSVDDTIYQIFYLVSRQYANVSRQGNNDLYVGTNSWAWTTWSTANMPATSYMNPTTHDYSQLGGFYWNLYCYPEDQPMPLDEASDISDPRNPYNNGCAGGETPATNPY